MIASDWIATARATNNTLVDSLVDAIHLVVELREEVRPEETITLALAERIYLMEAFIQQTIDGTLGD